MEARLKEAGSLLRLATIRAAMAFFVAAAPIWTHTSAAVPLASLALGGSIMSPGQESPASSDPGDEARAEYLLDIHDRYVAILDGYQELKSLMAPAVAQAGLSGPRLVDVAAVLVREHLARERDRALREMQKAAHAEVIEASWDGDVTAEDLAESNEFLSVFVVDATGYLEAVLAAADGKTPVPDGLRAVGSFLDSMMAYDEALQDAE
ncbi:hypothetical protein D3C71_538650 [compost metagenome]